MGKRAKPGDVAEVHGPAGRLIYLQYLGAHPKYGDSILVAVRMHETRPEIRVELFRDGYVTFYPFRAALSQGLAQISGISHPPKFRSDCVGLEPCTVDRS